MATTESTDTVTSRRSFVYRLYPNAAQTAALEQHLSEACRLYNAALQERREAYRVAGKSISFYDQSYQIKDIRADGDVSIANFSVCIDVLLRVELAFAAFFRRAKAKNGRAGYPRFRSVRRYDSIGFPQYGHGIRLRPNGRLYVQGIGELKIKLHRPFIGRALCASIKRNGGRWHVSLVAEIADRPLGASSAAVGIDVGISSFVALSDGRCVANPKHAREADRCVRIAQKRVARRQLKSRGRSRAIRLLQRAYAHTRSQRADFHHKTAHAIVHRHGLIAVEDLNIRGLARGRLAKSIHDAGWASFLNKLTYKAESAGRVLVRVNPAGTSQRCSGCGERVQKALSERRHHCPSCGLDLDRDVNAARNILALGLSVAGGTWDTGPCVPAEAA